LDETEMIRAGRTRREREQRLTDVLMRHRPQLRRMVELRLNPRLQGRIDPSDVLQEAFLEAARRLDDYLAALPMPLFVWLRRFAGQKLVDLERHHLGAKARDARRVLAIDGEPFPQASSASVAFGLLAKGVSAAEKAMQNEILARVEQALEGLDPVDGEFLRRHRHPPALRALRRF
jgi:RNA polymerase sigma-70 factor (ECF subfamily)